MSPITHDRCRQSLIKTRQFRLSDCGDDDVGRMLDHRAKIQGLRKDSVTFVSPLCKEVCSARWGMQNVSEHQEP